MHLERLELSNFRRFEKLELDFHKQLTVLVGNNGAGKTAALEAAGVAPFQKIENVSGLVIKKNDTTLKAYSLGSTDDVQSQYPVSITATGTINEKRDTWTRSLNGQGKNTTIEDAKFIAEGMDWNVTNSI